MALPVALMISGLSHEQYKNDVGALAMNCPPSPFLRRLNDVDARFDMVSSKDSGYDGNENGEWCECSKCNGSTKSIECTKYQESIRANLKVFMHCIDLIQKLEDQFYMRPLGATSLQRVAVEGKFI